MEHFCLISCGKSLARTKTFCQSCRKMSCISVLGSRRDCGNSNSRRPYGRAGASGWEKGFDNGAVPMMTKMLMIISRAQNNEANRFEYKLDEKVFYMHVLNTGENLDRFFLFPTHFLSFANANKNIFIAELSSFMHMRTKKIRFQFRKDSFSCQR